MKTHLYLAILLIASIFPATGQEADIPRRATAPKFLLKYVLWHKSLKYFKKSCVIGE
ncbi:hypothetical protein NBH15_28785 [Parabacteroides sp. W1-Q-101]|uniref:hypothetical protein n=1 Tax=Parabacteroides caeci TaxID=2949650 RepID=UPI00202FF357|nr:hypothetical protein [Parabacteroides sp. W1-Q-101]MCM0722247.1 hypothetical protein [Parabacteroides sp. W1-Q-101]